MNSELISTYKSKQDIFDMNLKIFPMITFLFDILFSFKVLKLRKQLTTEHKFENLICLFEMFSMLSQMAILSVSMCQFGFVVYLKQ